MYIDWLVVPRLKLVLSRIVVVSILFNYRPVPDIVAELITVLVNHIISTLLATPDYSTQAHQQLKTNKHL